MHSSRCLRCLNTIRFHWLQCCLALSYYVCLPSTASPWPSSPSCPSPGLSIFSPAASVSYPPQPSPLPDALVTMALGRRFDIVMDVVSESTRLQCATAGFSRHARGLCDKMSSTAMGSSRRGAPVSCAMSLASSAALKFTRYFCLGSSFRKGDDLSYACPHRSLRK